MIIGLASTDGPITGQVTMGEDRRGNEREAHGLTPADTPDASRGGRR